MIGSDDDAGGWDELYVVADDGASTQGLENLGVFDSGAWSALESNDADDNSEAVRDPASSHAENPGAVDNMSLHLPMCMHELETCVAPTGISIYCFACVFTKQR